MDDVMLRIQLETLAASWMRNQDRSADYQDGLADAAQALRAVLAQETTRVGGESHSRS